VDLACRERREGAGQPVRDRTQQRPGRHGVGLAVLGEPGQGQLLGRQAQE
jgi:hypothetical protein